MSKIITQKYTSVREIDLEFISRLEELLEGKIPSFEFITNAEKLASPDTKFNYFLFFGNQTNAPIGFAQIKLVKDAPQKKGFLQRLLKKNSPAREINENAAFWNISGTKGDGIVFNPKYSQHIGEKTTQVFKDIIEREDVYFQKINFSERYQKNLITSDAIKSSSQNEHIVIDSLLKNKSSYEEYLSSLADGTKNQIIQSWKYSQRELAFKMGEYENLKEAFHYKKRGGEQLKQLKQNEKFKLYNLKNAQMAFLTFETEVEIKALSFFIKGTGGHYFYDSIILDESLPELIPHQQVIMHFFEQTEGNRLHYLGEELQQDYLLKLGFTYTKQYSYTVKKNDH